MRKPARELAQMVSSVEPNICVQLADSLRIELAAQVAGLVSDYSNGDLF